MYEDINHQQAREIINFQISYNKGKIKATWVLAVCIVLMYLLEEYFGGSENINVLIRMGANVSDRVKAGEYYRLLSSVFLHAGFMHVFFNTYVLFALGGFFNRILGESRYLVIFFTSGIIGSLASATLGKASLSVGASGAIWGLFGASLVLSVFKTPFIPDAIRVRLRKVTLINLVINLGVSFLPMIDIWAHIGGGLGGFLVSLPIIFRPASPLMNKLVQYLFRVLAWILSLAYAASIIFGFYKFEPWTDSFNAKLVRHDLLPTPFSIAIPEHLPLDRVPKEQTQTFGFGDPKIDALLIDVSFFPEQSLGHKADFDWLKEQSQQLLTTSTVPAKTKKTVYLRSDDGGVLYYQQDVKDNEVTLHNYIFIRETYVIKLSLMAASNISQVRVDALASKIMGSVTYNK